ncbi:MAG: hypothetical protein V4658_00385 [Bacteroidota bacterium]
MRKLPLIFICLLVSVAAQAQLRSFSCFLTRDNDVNVEWVVEAYQSCEVTVEHSTDSFRGFPASIYSSVGECVGGDYGQGYSYKHSSPAFGVNYYRLNLGRYGYTQAIRIEVSDAPNGLKLAPNPFNERTKVTVQNNGAIYDLIILDMKGNIIRQQGGLYLPEFWLERSLLNEGFYYVILTDYRNFFTYAKIVIRDDY